MPLQGVIEDLAALDIGTAEMLPVYVTWEQIRAYDKREQYSLLNLTRGQLLDRERDFVSRLAACCNLRFVQYVQIRMSDDRPP